MSNSQKIQPRGGGSGRRSRLSTAGSHLGLLFYRQHIRSILRHPALFAINVAGIAVGVAVFLAIGLANGSANRSFRAGIELVAGRANLEVRGSIDDVLFERVASVPGVLAATPLLEGVVAIPGQPGEYIRLIGVDPFTGAGLQTFQLLTGDENSLDVEAWLREPTAIAVSAEFPKNLLRDGVVQVIAGGEIRSLEPLFRIEASDAATFADSRVVAMDIGWAQEFLGRPGELSAILISADPDKRAGVIERIREIVPGTAAVEAPARRGDQVESMLAAFQLNLTALSMVSILVGAFLIYNTISAAVIRRQTEIGILRATGVSRREIHALFLGEAAFAGVVGSIFGVLLAVPLASSLIEPVARTISSLYIVTSIDRLFLSPDRILLGFGIGVVASLAAGWLPAREAARCEPAKVLHPGAAMDRFAPVPIRWLIAGTALLLLAIGTGWGALGLRVPHLGFASAFFVLAGFSLCVPSIVQAGARLFRNAPGLWRLAAQYLGRSIHRNSVTVAALAAAIAMTVGISVMIHSFRQSVNTWIDSTLVSDLYIGSVANEAAALQAELPPTVIPWLMSRSEVRHIATFAELPLEFRGERTAMAVVAGARERETRFLGGGSAEKLAAFKMPGHVAVSEPFANRFNVREGESINLPTPEGFRAFKVAGIYQDYARDSGVVLIDRDSYEELWGASGVQSLGIELDPETGPEEFVGLFRKEFGDDGRFSIYSNAALRSRIFEIFDQTFAVTFVLRTIGIGVAAAGVLLALLILIAEREREIGVLRSLGSSRSQVVGIFLREAALVGAVSSVVGLASGACLAMVLTWVVNKAFFGWTIQLSYPIGLLASTPLWIIPVAVLAAFFPAIRAALVPPARALRFE